MCDGKGHPLHFHLIAGQTHESTALDEVLIGADEHLFDARGTAIAWPVALAGDQEYPAEWFDDDLLALGISPVIPSKENEDRDVRKVTLDQEAYPNRNIVERLIGWVKECRGVF